MDEQIIAVSDTGEVALNEDPVDSVQSKDLPQLTATLMRLKQSSGRGQGRPWLSRLPASRKPKYGRAIDVLNALAAAKIDNVNVHRQRGGISVRLLLWPQTRA